MKLQEYESKEKFTLSFNRVELEILHECLREYIDCMALENQPHNALENEFNSLLKANVNLINSERF